MPYKLSPLAVHDLQQLIMATMENYGHNQAEIYAQTLDNTLHKLAQHPALGRPREELYAGARSFPVERHIIFYQRRDDKSIGIARILHQRMDPTEHL